MGARVLVVAFLVAWPLGLASPGSPVRKLKPALIGTASISSWRSALQGSLHIDDNKFNVKHLGGVIRGHKKKDGNWTQIAQEVEEVDEEIEKELAVASADVQKAEELLHRGGELAYVVIIALTALLVAAIYADRGTVVVVATVCYVTALSSIPLGLKQLMSVQHFNFPAWLAAFHFIFTAMAGALIIKLQGKLVLCIGYRAFFRDIVPIACLFSASIVIINWGMSYSSVHFFEMISAATPLATCVVASVFGRPVNSKLVLPLVIVATAFVICFTGEVHFSRKGFILLVLGSSFRAVRSVLYQMVLQPRDFGTDDVCPLQLVTLICATSFPMMVALSFLTEGIEPFLSLHMEHWRMIRFTTVTAFVLNVSGTYCIRELGAIGAQVAGELSDLTVAMGAMAMFGEKMTTSQTIAYLVMCCGITLYTKRDKALQDFKEKAVPDAPSYMTIDIRKLQGAFADVATKG